jgi:hypothetical protein
VKRFGTLKSISDLPLSRLKEKCNFGKIVAIGLLDNMADFGRLFRKRWNGLSMIMPGGVGLARFWWFGCPHNVGQLVVFCRGELVSSGPESRSGREGTAGEPPPVVKYLIWLLNRENWVKHRIAIILGVLGLALIGWFEIVPKILNPDSKSTASREDGSHSSRSTTPPESDDHVGLLSDDDAMPAIEKALDGGDVGESIRLVSLMRPGIVKTNECEHVYNYTIKHVRLDDAKNIVGLCWEGELKQQRLDEILHESLKK